MSNTESEPYETPEEIRSRIVRGYLTDNGIAPTKQDAEIASLQQQLSDCKSALRAVEANCDCKQINELAGMVGMKFVSWKAKAEVAEAERDEARRQRNDIRKAWEGADARAKAAEQELAEARAMIESRERNWLASVDNEVAANRKLEAAEAREKQVRAETIEECLRICDHAKLHYKGPVAMKIRREIAVLLSRALASKEGGNG